MKNDQGKVTFKDIVEYLQSLSAAQCNLHSQVVGLVTLVLVMPATNATSERSFSCLQRTKSYLWSTMTQLRLNNTMILHVHKDLTDNPNLIEVANDFVANKQEHRLKVFGLFKQNEFQKLAVCTSCGKASKCIHCSYIATWLSIFLYYDGDVWFH